VLNKLQWKLWAWLRLRENVVGQICKFCGQELKTDESKAREENSRTIENRLRVANNLNPR